MLSLPTQPANGNRYGAVRDPSMVIKLLLRKRYSKLGPAGDYSSAQSSTYLSRFSKSAPRRPSSKSLKLGDHGSTGSELSRSDPSPSNGGMSRSTASESAWPHDQAVQNAPGPTQVPKSKNNLKRETTLQRVFGQSRRAESSDTRANNSVDNLMGALENWFKQDLSGKSNNVKISRGTTGM